ncbi:hypothetical protein EIP91_002434 [Steccherinum ochraceum]|uniref:B30.2/SPRY domain-containing protein n=1 Tax=Steccherinum ochraceum TaxID=92696 RepID=A0A4R0RKP5_9APHY|nr:hypothetical protein EIP91_002434 [Steccherinum ochraceum]
MEAVSTPREQSPEVAVLPIATSSSTFAVSKKRKHAALASGAAASPAPSDRGNTPAPTDNIVLPARPLDLSSRPRLTISRHPSFIPIAPGSEYHATEPLCINRLNFRYTPAGLSAPGSAYPFRTIESAPPRFRVSWEDRSPFVKVTQDGLGLRGERGFRSARCNAPVREGKWYMEVKSPEVAVLPIATSSSTFAVSKKRKHAALASGAAASPAPSDRGNTPAPTDNIVLPARPLDLSSRPRLTISRHPSFIPIAPGSEYYATEPLCINRLNFRYTPAGLSAPGSAYPFRTIESAPPRFRVSWEDRSPFVKVTQDGLGLRGERGFRSARCNAPVREGKWYMEVKVEQGGGETVADNTVTEGSHVRMGWARREAPLNGPAGLDGYSYALRDKTGDKVHLARPKPYGRSFGSGDVIGMYISLPPRREAELNDPRDPRHIKRERIAIEFKGQEYFESYEYSQSKEMLSLMSSNDRGKNSTSTPAPATTKKSATVKNLPSTGRGSKSGVAEPAPLRPLPTLGPDSCIAFFVNGESQGIAFQDLYDYVPLREHSNKVQEKKRVNKEGLREHKANPFDDGSLGYYPVISLFNQAKVRINPGPDFDYPPPPDIDALLMSEDVSSSDIKPTAERKWRPLFDRYPEYMAEQFALDEKEEAETALSHQAAVETQEHSQVDQERLERHREKRRQQAAARKERKRKEELEAKRQRVGDGTPSIDGHSSVPSIYLMGESGSVEHAPSPAPTVASSVDASAFWPPTGADTSEYNTDAEAEDYEDGNVPRLDDDDGGMDIEDELAAAAGCANISLFVFPADSKPERTSSVDYTWLPLRPCNLPLESPLHPARMSAIQVFLNDDIAPHIFYHLHEGRERIARALFPDPLTSAERVYRRSCYALARVCRSTLDPGLDALWHRLSSLRPLLTLLRNFHRISFTRQFAITGPTDSSDWARLQFYAKKVRIVHLFEDIGILDSSIFMILMETCAGEPLLPQLRDLRVTHLHLRGIPLPLISPTVQHATFSYSHLLPTFGNLSIHRHPRGQDVVVLQRLPIELQSLVVDELVLTSNATAIISHLRHLRFLKLSRTGGTPQDYICIYQALPGMLRLHTLYLNFDFSAIAQLPPGVLILLPSLKRITLFGDLAHINALLSIVVTPVLCDLAVHCHDDAQTNAQANTCVQRFVELSGRHIDSAADRSSISLYVWNRDISDITPYADTTMQCLASWTHLHRLGSISFVLNPFPASSLTDDDLNDMAKAWPNIRALHIEDLTRRTLTTLPNLRILNSFTRRCPKLVHLSIPLDVDVTSIPSPSDSPASQTVTYFRAIQLLPPDADADIVEAVARYLWSVLPSLNYENVVLPEPFSAVADVYRRIRSESSDCAIGEDRT